MRPETKRTLDKEVERSASKCPGGESCKCCGPGCDCGCRNECPKFRGLIASKIGRFSDGKFVVTDLSKSCSVGNVEAWAGPIPSPKDDEIHRLDESSK